MARIAGNLACWGLLACACFCTWGCHAGRARSEPVLVFDQVPLPGPSGAGATGVLRGHVRGARAGQHVVLYALSGTTWWIQPLTIRPLTEIAADGSWSNATHLGTRYAALLVNPGFVPAHQMETLPAENQEYAAVATVAPSGGPAPVQHLRFSNYDWDIREIGSDRNGSPHNYDLANASVDARGALHLHITRTPSGWACAEVALGRSLGYGTYVFSVGDVARMDPAAVLSFFTWDAMGTDQDRREMAAVVSQWGSPRGSNAQYIVQPFYRPANTYRYVAPAGALTFMLRWDPSKTTFTTVRGSGPAGRRTTIAEHAFTSDVPTPRTESVHINLCTFDYTPAPQQQATEVVVQRFQFLP
ncbi:hypothetical protein [Acidipila sp. EB88]|uniref:hypothetical protein n=1 Tax=Acidipila sp. EB88 TaxID=2305226 RepID=UPI000F5FB249|nr:hypothetical protein [Acidipila sp. EB88]RRA48823.1 hypothetical protein D1Y84_11530 [Acidipila sp. EB88]